MSRIDKTRMLKIKNMKFSIVQQGSSKSSPEKLRTASAVSGSGNTPRKRKIGTNGNYWCLYQGL
jgi:hypothetical protein